MKKLLILLAFVGGLAACGDDKDYEAIEAENTAEFHEAWDTLERDRGSDERTYEVDGAVQRDWCGALIILGNEEVGQTFANAYKTYFSGGEYDEVDKDSFVGTWLLGDLIQEGCDLRSG